MEPNTNPLKIAIVDDHKLFRQGIIQILNKFAHFELTIEAESCQQLLNALQLQLPDVVLMDLEMPGMDGIAGCKKILDEFPNLKIIALSMHSAENFIFHMMKSGARSYLPKDIDQEILKEAIEQVASKGFYFTDKIATAMMRGVKSKSHAPLLVNNKNSLTQREREILELICKGLTANEIAVKLFISIRTVEGHRQNLLDKTGTTNSVSLAVYAIKNGILS